MSQKHTRSGVAHYLLDVVLHGRLIAVDWASLAGRFLDSIRTMIEATPGVIHQLAALGAELRRCRVMRAAIDFDHLADRSLLSANSRRGLSRQLELLSISLPTEAVYRRHPLHDTAKPIIPSRTARVGKKQLGAVSPADARRVALASPACSERKKTPRGPSHRATPDCPQESG